MMTKITQRIAANRQTTAKDLILYDDALAGFCPRVRPTGTKIWYFRYRTPGGPQRRLVLGRLPGIGAAMARQLAMVAAGDVARGIDVLAQRREVAAENLRSRQSTLKTFITERYEPWALTYLRTGEFQLERIRADFAEWLDKPLADLSPWLSDQWRKRQIATGMAPVTVNRNLQRLRALVAKAVMWKVIDQHPFAEVKPLRCDRTGRARYLSDTEEQQLRDALFAREQELRRNRESFDRWRDVRGIAPLPLRAAEFIDHVRPMALLALKTGMRRGELLKLQWRDVDIDDKWLGRVIPKNKSEHTAGEAQRANLAYCHDRQLMARMDHLGNNDGVSLMGKDRVDTDPRSLLAGAVGLVSTTAETPWAFDETPWAFDAPVTGPQPPMDGEERDV